jgi:hypothetical protein
MRRHRGTEDWRVVSTPFQFFFSVWPSTRRSGQSCFFCTRLAPADGARVGRRRLHFTKTGVRPLRWRIAIESSRGSLRRVERRVGAPIGALTRRPMTMLRAALNATSSERSKKLPKASDDLRWLLDRADALAEDVQRDQQCRDRRGGAPTPLPKGPDLAGFATPLGILPRRDRRGSWRLASNWMDGPPGALVAFSALAPCPNGRAKRQSAKLSPLRTLASLDVAAV